MSLEKPSFWISESNPVKVIAISTVWLPEMEKIMMSP